jgi:hypothetical protein
MHIYCEIRLLPDVPEMKQDAIDVEEKRPDAH